KRAPLTLPPLSLYDSRFSRGRRGSSRRFRHLEIMLVIPSLRSRASSERSEGSLRQARQILRCAQDDSQDPSHVSLTLSPRAIHCALLVCSTGVMQAEVTCQVTCYLMDGDFSRASFYTL